MSGLSIGIVEVFLVDSVGVELVWCSDSDVVFCIV